MRSRTTAENNLIAAGAMAPHCRVSIQDSGGTYQPFEDWAYRVAIKDDIDSPCMEASITLMFRNAPSTNLSPLAGSTAWAVGRRVRVEAGIGAIGATPATFHNIFEGHLERPDFVGDHAITWRCRDLGLPLMVARIETTFVHQSAGTNLETVMQDILNAWGGSVGLHVPVSPGYLLTYAKFESCETVLEALQGLADLIGWIVRYRWDSGTSSWRLTLYEPRRGITTPDYTVPPSHYGEDSSFEIDPTTIVNVLRVAYGTGNPRPSYTVSDSASIAAFWRRFARIPELENSPIDTLAEAQRMADAIIADLKDPKGTGRFNLGPFPFAEVGDYYRFSPDNLRYTADQDLAIVSVDHVYEVTESGDMTADTSVTVRGKPSSANGRWWDYIPPVEPPSNTTPPGTPTSLTGNFTGRDALLTWTAPTNVTPNAYEVRVFNGVTPNQLLRTAQVNDTRYIYSLEENRADGGPRPDLDFEVRSIYGANISSAASLTLVNLAPSAPTGLTLAAADGGLGVNLTVAEPTFGDYLQLEVQTDDNAGFTSPTDAYAGASWRAVPIGADSVTAPTHIRARFRDVFNQASGWTASSVTAKPVTAAYLDFLLGGVNLLKNGGFDYGYASSVIGDNWTIYRQSVTGGGWDRLAGGVLGSEFQRHEGTFTAANGRLGVQQDISLQGGIVPNANYTLSVFAALTLQAGHSLRLYVDWINSAGTYISTTSQIVATGVNNPGVFVRYSATFLSPAGAARAAVYIWAEGSSGFASIDLDAAMFEFGDKPTFYQESAIFGNLGARSLRALDLTAVQGTFTNGTNKAFIDSRGVRVFNSAGVEKVAFGNMNGLQRGSTTWGSVFGLWVGAGANVYLHDYPQVLHVGRHTATGSKSTAANTNDFIAFANSTTVDLGSVISIASGRRAMVGFMPLLVGVDSNINAVMRSYTIYVELSLDGTNWIYSNASTFVGPITFRYVRASGTVAYRNNEATTQTVQCTYDGTAYVFEVPA